jgi:hypothetical protein
MIDLDNEARTLIELARDAHDPGDDDRARVRAALASRIGVAAGLGLAAAGLGAVAKTTTATAGASATAGAGAGAGAGMAAGAVAAGTGALKLLGAALVVSATLGAGAAAVHHARRAPVARVAFAEKASPLSPRPRAAVGVAVDPAAAPPAAPPGASVPASDPIAESAKVNPSDPSDAPPAVSSVAKKPPTAHAIVAAPKAGLGDAGDRHAAPAARPSAPAVADEASLFHDGIVALRSGQPARALVLFDFHARLYPHGVLAEEREAERALALADLGRTTEARAAIDRFLQAHPASPLAARLLARARLLDPAP